MLTGKRKINFHLTWIDTHVFVNSSGVIVQHIWVSFYTILVLMEFVDNRNAKFTTAKEVNTLCNVINDL